MIREILFLLIVHCATSQPVQKVGGYFRDVKWNFSPQILSTFMIYGDHKIDKVGYYIDETRNESVKALSSLSNKNIKYLPEKVYEVFPNLIAYQIVKCSLNLITRRNFEKLHKLEWLHLGFNEIRVIGETVFSDLNSLKFLDLSHNKINLINARAFTSLTKLSEVHLHHNELDKLDVMVFNNVINLKKLSLEYNKLDHLESENGNHHFHNNINLEFIWLKNNRLSFIGEKVFEYMRNLRYVDLRNNSCVSKEFFEGDQAEMRKYFHNFC